MSHQGFGFCEFFTEEDAEYACRIMNGIKLFGKPIRVNKVRYDTASIVFFKLLMCHAGFIGQEADRHRGEPLHWQPGHQRRRDDTLERLQ